MEKRVIAISGLPGSGSTTASKILAEKLNLNLFSPGKLFKDIASGNFKDKYYSKLFDEICRSKRVEIPVFKSEGDSHGALNLWNTNFGKSKKFHEAIDELQIKLAEQGDIIFDGKLSLHMIKNAFPKIWLTASLEKRAERISEREKLKLKEARKIVEQRQNAERLEWKNIYDVDYWQQESKADIIINTSDLNQEQV